MQPMTVRRMKFDFTPDMERVFVKDDPEMSYTFLGTWMMLPYLEPYLIRSMRQALPHITDAELKEDLKRFCAQEGEHFKQHAQANELIRDLVPGFAALKPIEAALDAEFKAFSKDKPLKFNLAYAEGFESMTSAMSRTQLETHMFDRTDSPLGALARWHVMEEVEHRTVAFDVYEHVVGSYWYRLRIGLWAQKHFIGWGTKLAKAMMDADPATFERFQDAESVAARKAYTRLFWARGLPRLLQTYLPGYDPRKVDLPPEYEAARREFSGAAISLA
jgi:uncharacterized protein